MESHAELRAKKAQTSVTDDALLAAGIADQLWAVMVLTDVPGDGKVVVCTSLREGALSSAHVKRCEANL